MDAIFVVEEGPTVHGLNFILAKNLKALLCPVVVLVFHSVFPGITILRERPTRYTFWDLPVDVSHSMFHNRFLKSF